MKKWYAVQTDSSDAWDNGSYDYDEAVEMLKKQGCGLIAEIEEDEDDKVCVGEIPYEKIADDLYTVYWIAGEKDGEILATFHDENDAIKFAKETYKQHEDEFDEVWGGIGIDDKAGRTIEW